MADSTNQQNSARPTTDAIKPRTQWEHAKPVEVEESSVPRPPVDTEKIRKTVRFAVFALGGIIALTALGAYLATVLQQKPDPLAISVQISQQSNPGQVAQFSVSLVNQDASDALRDVTVTVKADAGTIFPDAPQFATVQRSLSSVSAKATDTETFSAIFWGKAGDQRSLDVAVRYKFGSTDTVYEKTSQIATVIGSDPVSLNLQTPDQVLPGQNFLFSLQYANAGTQAIANAQIVFDIPQGMRVLQTDPALPNATSSSPAFTLANFAQNQKGTISAKSVVDDSQGQGKKIVAHVTTLIRGQAFEITQTSANLLVIASPLQVRMSVQGKPEYHATIGEGLSYEVSVTNNYSYALKDVVVNADVSAPWFVPQTIQVRNGSYSSRTKTVTWNGGSDQKLLTLDPGKTETVSFSVSLKSAFWQNLTNNIITVKATVSASNRPEGVGTQIASSAQIQTKVNGTLALEAPVYFKDPKGTFSNIGTIPPRANQLNQYTVYVKVAAQGNDFHDLQVSTVLPGNVTFEGKVKGDVAGFVYNPRTNEIDWDISQMAAYSSKQIAFQINFIPSVAQVGRAALILDKVTFTGTDTFTGDVLTQSQEARFSNLPDDPSMNEDNGKIAP